MPERGLGIRAPFCCLPTAWAQTLPRHSGHIATRNSPTSRLEPLFVLQFTLCPASNKSPISKSVFLLPTYNRYPVAFERGKGVFLYDFEGKKYLDFVAGLGVNALGHAHPRIVKAIREQAARVIHLSNLYYNEYQGQLAERLCQFSGLDRVFFSNSGTEAMEGAIKLARLAGHKAGGDAKCATRGAARLVSRPDVRCHVPHRPGQVPQRLRASARKRNVC